jgi:hypothetical protein
MTAGAALSVRERERQPRARNGPPAGPRCWASESTGERASAWAAQWAAPEGEKGSARFGFVFVFVFQINE